MCEMPATSSLDLITLNNVIVGLRAPIVQARVHVIHHLSRQVAALEKKKTQNEAQRNKNKRKADRFRNEILALKKLSRGDAAKFALKNRKELNDVFEKHSEDIELRAKSRICEHPSVKEKVTAFRKKFPTWKDELHRLYQFLGRKQAKKSKLQKQKKKEKVLIKQRDKYRQLKGIESKAAKANPPKRASRADKEAKRSEEDVTSDDSSDQESDEEENGEGASSRSESSSINGGALEEAHPEETPSNAESKPSSDQDSGDVESEEDSRFKLFPLVPIPASESHDALEETLSTRSEEESGSDSDEEAESDESNESVVSKQEDNSENEGSSTSPEEVEKTLKKDSFFIGGEESGESDDDNENEVKESSTGGQSNNEQGGPFVNRAQEKGRGSFRDSSRGNRPGRGSYHQGHNRGELRGRGQRGHRDGNAEGTYRGRGRGRGVFSDEGRGRGAFCVGGRGRGAFSDRSRGAFKDRGRGTFRGGNRGRVAIKGRGGFNDRGRGAIRGRGGTRGREEGMRGQTFPRHGFDQKFSRNRGEKRPQSSNPTTEAKKPKLHPSWEAKKGQQAKITTFQGQKVTFDN